MFIFKMKTEHWNTDQIDDFIRKLGFLDKHKETEVGNMVKHFLFVNEVSTYNNENTLVQNPRRAALA